MAAPPAKQPTLAVPKILTCTSTENQEKRALEVRLTCGMGSSQFSPLVERGREKLNILKLSLTTISGEKV
jgi:hypothetical protein